ncbi:MAG: transcriptional regulator [Pseudomonadota bacterium]
MTPPDLLVPGPIFHQSVRTRLALLLYTGEPSFTALKVALTITDGNLDAHLRKLGAAGYVHSRMVRDGRPARSTVSLRAGEPRSGPTWMS